MNYATKAASAAAREEGREICGLLLCNGYFLELVHVRNKWKSGGGFAFYANEIRKVKKLAAAFDHQIVGTFHSHPVSVAVPGESDIFHAVENSLMLIFDVMGKTCALWRISRQKAKPVAFDLI